MAKSRYFSFVGVLNAPEDVQLKDVDTMEGDFFDPIKPDEWGERKYAPIDQTNCRTWIYPHISGEYGVMEHSFGDTIEIGVISLPFSRHEENENPNPIPQL